MPKILIVDDEESLAEILKDYLLESGHQVVVCLDSTAAVAKAVEIKPDIALIDYQMPGKTGVELLVDLRKHEETRKLPVLFVSGTQTVRFAAQIPSEPNVRFVSKPVDLDTLSGVIREMLDPNGWSTPH